MMRKFSVSSNPPRIGIRTIIITMATSAVFGCTSAPKTFVESTLVSAVVVNEETREHIRESIDLNDKSSETLFSRFKKWADERDD